MISPSILHVGSRSSPLAKAQVLEVQGLIHHFHPLLIFKGVFVETSGDKDQKTSLRSLDKTDFFTKEVDQLLLSGKCRIAIHSAKDLPEQIPQGIVIVALTKGQDPSDVLVLRDNEHLGALPDGAVIATSSTRREEAVRELTSGVSFCDIRGTIHQRLAKLDTKEIDGVVVAEAALIRLGLNHLNRIKLPGETTRFQGQLAIMARADDHEIKEIFSCLDTRKG